MSKTRRTHGILDAKDGQADLNEVMTEKFQHLNTKECKIFLNLLQKYEDLFDDTLGVLNTTLVD